MKVLFIHQNFPGQFRHIAAHLARQPGCQVLAIGRDSAPGLPGVELLRYRPHRAASPQTHPYARSFEDAVLHGQQVLRLMLDLEWRAGELLPAAADCRAGCGSSGVAAALQRVAQGCLWSSAELFNS